MPDREIVQILKASFARPLSKNPHVRSILVERENDGWELHVFVDALGPDITRRVAEQAGVAFDVMNARLYPLPMDFHVWDYRRRPQQSGASSHRLLDR